MQLIRVTEDQFESTGARTLKHVPTGGHYATYNYQRLPPERRQQIQQRFERYQSLSPEQRERMDRNLERWRNMTPEQREQAREQIRQRRQQRQQQPRELRPHGDVGGSAHRPR